MNHEHEDGPRHGRGYDCGSGRERRRAWKLAMMAGALGQTFGGQTFGGREFGSGRGDRGFGGFGGGRGRRGRMLDGDGLRLLVLHLLSDKPAHGYELMKAVEEMSGGHYAPSAGVLYPLLTLLADMGLIVEEPSDGNRRAFGLTDEGRAHLAANREAADAAVARITALASDRNGRDAAPVARAMMNLGAALAARLRAEGVDRETVLKAAAIIDAAAQEVERL